MKGLAPRLLDGSFSSGTVEEATARPVQDSRELAHALSIHSCDSRDPM